MSLYESCRTIRQNDEMLADDLFKIANDPRRCDILKGWCYRRGSELIIEYRPKTDQSPAIYAECNRYRLLHRDDEFIVVDDLYEALTISLYGV